MYVSYRTKRKIRTAIVVVLILLLTGVGVFYFFKYLEKNNSSSTQTEALSYTVMYFNGTEIRTLTVKMGDLWYISEIPTKAGYVFKGYFDAEEGGAQYTTSDGVCLSAFDETDHLILYPQFKKTP